MGSSLKAKATSDVEWPLFSRRSVALSVIAGAMPALPEGEPKQHAPFAESPIPPKQLTQLQRNHSPFSPSAAKESAIHPP